MTSFLLFHKEWVSCQIVAINFGVHVIGLRCLFSCLWVKKPSRHLFADSTSKKLVPAYFLLTISNERKAFAVGRGRIYPVYVVHY
jgi:hypothetical protein